MTDPPNYTPEFWNRLQAQLASEAERHVMDPARHALLTYGEHHQSCSYWTDRPTCSCGLDDALRDLAAPSRSGGGIG